MSALRAGFFSAAIGTAHDGVAGRSQTDTPSTCPTQTSVLYAPLPASLLSSFCPLPQRRAPPVGVRDLDDRTARRATELPRRIAKRDQRRDFDVVRHPEHLLDLGVAEAVMHRRERAADAE